MQALRNEDITIYGAGTQTRSFCFVDDLIDAFLAMMGPPADVTGPINIGNPGEFTMLELAEAILRLTGSRSGIQFSPLPQDDPERRQSDITIARTSLGWEPRIDFDEGLAATNSYFRHQVS